MLKESSFTSIFSTQSLRNYLENFELPAWSRSRRGEYDVLQGGQDLEGGVRQARSLLEQLLLDRGTYYWITFCLIATNVFLAVVAFILSFVRDQDFITDTPKYGLLGGISIIQLIIICTLIIKNAPSSNTLAGTHLSGSVVLIMTLLFFVLALRVTHSSDDPSCQNGDVRCSFITILTITGCLAPITLFIAARITFLAALRARGNEAVPAPVEPERPATVPAWMLATNAETTNILADGQINLY